MLDEIFEEGTTALSTPTATCWGRVARFCWCKRVLYSQHVCDSATSCGYGLPSHSPSIHTAEEQHSSQQVAGRARCLVSRNSKFEMFLVRGFRTAIFAFVKREKGAKSTEPTRQGVHFLLPTVPDLAIRGVEAALRVLSVSGGDLHPKPTEPQGVCLRRQL